MTHARVRIHNGGAFVRISPEGGAGRIKRCAGCQRDKPLAAFTKGTGPGGLHRHCRDCCRAWRRLHKSHA